MLERYYQNLLNFVARKTGCRDQARDIVQESYARMLGQYAQESHDIPPRQQLARLFLTARHLLVDRFRKQQNQADSLPLPDELPAASQQHQPEWQLMQQQQAQELLQAIDALPPRCREAFTRFKFEGQSQKEIAEAMGISVNMVEKHIIRGMLSCKQALHDLEGDHD